MILSKGNIISIRWLKHPNFKNLQPNEIVASWRGKFLYKKENIQESILGLRAPQLGAIYAFMSKPKFIMVGISLSCLLEQERQKQC